MNYTHYATADILYKPRQIICTYATYFIYNVVHEQLSMATFLAVPDISIDYWKEIIK